MENGNFAFVKISHTDIRRANAPTGRRKPMIFVRNAMICPRSQRRKRGVLSLAMISPGVARPHSPCFRRHSGKAL
jgi:hypothetical protein